MFTACLFYMTQYNHMRSPGHMMDDNISRVWIVKNEYKPLFRCQWFLNLLSLPALAYTLLLFCAQTWLNFHQDFTNHQTQGTLFSQVMQPCSTAQFSCKVHQFLRYVHNCLKLIIIIKMSTKSDVSESLIFFVNKSLGCFFYAGQA